MLAKDIMTCNVMTVTPGSSVRDAARLMMDKHLGGLPVISTEGDLVGMLTESDLLRRVEAGTERRRSRWAAAFANPDQMAREYIKAHGLKVHEVMSRPVVAVRDDAELADIADTLDKNRVKRVPVIRDGRVVGIISRRDLVRIVARTEASERSNAASDDGKVQAAILAKMREQRWLDAGFVGIAVKDGVVETTGFVRSKEQHAALRVMIEETPGVSAIHNNVRAGYPPGGWI